MNVISQITLIILLTACANEDKNFAKKEQSKESAVTLEKIPAPKRTGQTVFVACSACHGLDASKQALGKSKIIKGWESSKIINALKGYKNETYGGSMKGIMKGQVSVLSENDIKAVAEYISKL